MLELTVDAEPTPTGAAPASIPCTLTLQVKALQAKLQEREAALQQAERALAGLQLAQQQEEQWQPQRRASEGEAAGEGVELGRLRLEYLQAKASLESTTACNTRLIKVGGKTSSGGVPLIGGDGDAWVGVSVGVGGWAVLSEVPIALKAPAKQTTVS